MHDPKIRSEINKRVVHTNTMIKQQSTLKPDFKIKITNKLRSLIMKQKTKGEADLNTNDEEINQLIDKVVHLQDTTNAKKKYFFDYTAAELSSNMPIEQIAMLRNAKENYRKLEKHFGTLNAGCSFGESCMFGQEST